MAPFVKRGTINASCGRCGAIEITIACYHFGTTYTCECGNCGWGSIDGDDEDIAKARYRGKCMEHAQNAAPTI